MNHCKLCGVLNIDSYDSDVDAIKPKEHAKIHQKQLQIVTGQKVSLEEIMRSCFGGVNLEKIEPKESIDADVKKESATTTRNPKSKAKNVTCPINKVCHEVHEKNGRKKAMPCSKCGNTLSVIFAGDFNSTFVKDHACVHLGKDIFKCGVCEFKCPSRATVAVHLVKKHGVPGNSRNYINKSSDYEADIIDMIRRCFGEPVMDVNQESISKTNTNRVRTLKCPIYKVCHEFYQKHDRKAAMDCSECGFKLVVRTSRGFLAARIKNHVCLHLDKKDMYQCRFCKYKWPTQNGIKMHLADVHKLSGNRKNYIDRIKDYESDFINMIRRCFGGHQISNEQNNPSQGSISIDMDVKQENAISQFDIVRPKLNKKKMRTVKCLVSKACHEVCKKHASKKAMRCALCGIELAVMAQGLFNSRSVENHAAIHLGKDIFECRFCDYKRPSHFSINHHLKVTHNLPGTRQNSIDNTSLYEAEMIDMVRRCFGQDQAIANE